LPCRKSLELPFFLSIITNGIQVEALNIADDATTSLIQAEYEQNQIGWENWLKGRWSMIWATLINYDIANVDSGIKHNTSEKWANEILKLNWEFVFNIWLERNKSEHDERGNPKLRRKEKLIKKIQGESAIMNFSVYKENEMTSEELIKLPIENLIMIESNLKNAKSIKKNGILVPM
jgi:hypothetical protein